MNTPLVIALLGFVLACGIPTSANQSHLRHRLVRQIDTQECPMTCNGDTGENVAIVNQNTYIIISREENRRFMLVFNIDRNVALYYNLDIRLAALINLETRGSIAYEIDTGIAFYLKLTFNVEVDFQNVVTEDLFQLSLDIESQIVAATDENLYHFRIFLMLTRVAGGDPISVIFEENAEVGASIEADLGVLLRAIGERISETGGNAVAVVKAIVRSTVTIEIYVKFFINLSVRLPASLPDPYVVIFINACKAGGQAVVEAAQLISGAVSALGEVVIADNREWTFDVQPGVSYSVSIARDSLNKFWSLIWIPIGADSGAFEIGFVRNFLFIFNKKNNWVNVVGIGRFGIWNMVEGTGVIINEGYVATVYRNPEIREKWQYFLDTLIVPTLQSGLGQGFNVTSITDVGRSYNLTEFDADVRAGDTTNISAEFLDDFNFYADYLREDIQRNGTGVCFSGFSGLDAFEDSLISVFNTISGLGKPARSYFSTIANVLFDTIFAVARIEQGFSFNWEQVTKW